MNYISTRGNNQKMTSAQAIIAGLADDGGLFVPTAIPTLAVSALAGKSYQEIAYEVMKLFLMILAQMLLKSACFLTPGS